MFLLSELLLILSNVNYSGEFKNKIVLYKSPTGKIDLKVSSKMELTADDGKKYLTNFYNLDGIRGFSG